MPDNEKLVAPLSPHEKRLEEIWAKLEALGINEQDVIDAVAWARQESRASVSSESVAPGETEVFVLPEPWFEYSVADGVDERKPGIYQWTIEGVGSYIGKYSHIDRPKKQYGRNVENKINVRPYRRSNEEGFRRIHEALAEAVKKNRKIQLRILQNADPVELNACEQAFIRQLRPELNG
jgi:hypothetical protein